MKALKKLPRVLTAQEMAAVDNLTIGEIGIPGRVLMENAGREVFAVIAGRWQPLAQKRFVVFCGKGNNGGDGFVIARLLSLAGGACQTFLLGEPDQLQGDARANYEVMEKLEIPVTPLSADDRLPDLTASDLIIDAILGTGVKGPLRGLIAKVVEHINASHKPCLAVDFPTGMNADSGAVEGPCIQATVTVTMGARKLGHLFSPGREQLGELIVADIGFPDKAFEQAPNRFLLAGENLRNWLPPRASDSFKNSVGQILVIAGSRGFDGAAKLTAGAALRTGAGLVILAVPESLLPAMTAATPEVIKLPLPDSQTGSITSDALSALEARLEWADVVALGPGLGTAEETKRFVKELLRHAGKTVVIDADGLNVLAGDLELLQKCQARLILTPHPGELSRLLAIEKREITADPVKAASQAAEQTGHVVILKGAPTVIATPAGEVMINSTGNAGMATAGSGDVLTGIVAALAGQGLAPELAAGLGVYLHGLAGDFAAQKLGQRSMIAGDLIRFLPKAFLDTESRAPATS